LKKYLIIPILSILLTAHISANAQQTRNSGWAFSLNTFKLNEKFTFFFDTQIRTTDKWAQTETFIFRPAIGYALNKQTILSFGIASITNWRELKYIGPADEDATIRDGVPDNRIWQQLIINKPYGTSTLQHRFRLEERTIGTLEKEGENILKKNPKLNARFRYFNRYIQPFSKAKSFQKGMYWAFQNEFFFNTVGAKYANNKVFDQFRTYGGIGYRVSKQFDLELGYMFQFILQRNGGNTQNHITQLSTFLRL
jgi:hypothetical protein